MDLIDCFLNLENRDEAYAFLRDLMTPAEIKAFNERWEIVKLLELGQSYRSIAEATGASATTVTRVARFLKDEPYQGYRTMLNKSKEREEL